MATHTGNTRGGSSEQHAKAGHESHKNSGVKAAGGSSSSSKGGASAQQSKAGQQSHKH